MKNLKITINSLESKFIIDYKTLRDLLFFNLYKMKPTIKFSHNYKKLSVVGNDMSAVLIGVIGVELSKLDKEFKDFDTDNGVFKLPKSGLYMLLIFKAQRGIFPTLRAAYPSSKVKYYRDLVGENFNVIINN